MNFTAVIVLIAIVLCMLIAFANIGFLLYKQSKKKPESLPRNAPSSPFRTKIEIDEEKNIKEFYIAGESTTVCPVCGLDKTLTKSLYDKHSVTLCHPHKRVSIRQQSWYKKGRVCQISNIHHHCTCYACNAKWIVVSKNVPWEEIR